MIGSATVGPLHSKNQTSLDKYGPPSHSRDHQACKLYDAVYYMDMMMRIRLKPFLSSASKALIHTAVRVVLATFFVKLMDMGTI